MIPKKCDQNMSLCQPFIVDIADETLDAVREKVAAYPWHEMPDDGGWGYGTNLDYMKELAEYWVNDYDWRKHETALNEFPQFKAEVDGIDMHFIHEIGSGPSPKPLLITHGWPGSVVEFMEVIEPLAHPERFGGRIEDAFTVISPSLPGFGFSGRPPRPYGPRKMAEVLNSLMVDVLGYDNYIAQGGDWGGTIAAYIGFDYPENCKAIHINILTVRHPDGPQTEEEKEWEKQFDFDQIMEDGYRTQQATRPQTLSYGMMDSPIGVAAWILEKYNSWSDTDGDNVESVYTKDELLTNIMIYIVTRTFNTASWIYYGRREEGGRIYPKKVNLLKFLRVALCSPKKCQLGHQEVMSSVCVMFNIGQKCPVEDILVQWKNPNYWLKIYEHLQESYKQLIRTI